MSSVEFKFDEAAFDQAIKDVANQGLVRLARELQQLVDQIGRTAEGRPLAVVKDELRAAAQAHDFNLPEEHLSAYATQLTHGGRVVIKPELLS